MTAELRGQTLSLKHEISEDPAVLSTAHGRVSTAGFFTFTQG